MAPKKKSLADAIALPDTALTEPAAPPAPPQTQPKKKAAPSRAGKTFVGGYFDPAAAKQLKKLAIDLDITQEQAIAQALNMLLESQGKPPVF